MELGDLKVDGTRACDGARAYRPPLRRRLLLGHRKSMFMSWLMAGAME